ncbi:aldehyde oxidase GLOX-like [Euphorbia lathyris]|uniref:aldehyde oxidase GLOX-like n=1 Tax=Euphorbia lathyris TaxID=212925 RepID=UPI00331407D0
MPSLSFLLLLLFLLPIICRNFQAEASGGRWRILQNNIGITAMHMQLLSNDRVIIFDRTDFGVSNLSLPAGKCRDDPNEMVLKTDCTAHSVEYDVLTNKIRPLMVQTDVWCSSGSVTPDGRLIQTGGFNDGERKVRIFNPCSNCDWEEVGDGLKARRWYATNHKLTDGRQIVIGGRRQFNYEFYPKNDAASNVYSLSFLVQTNDKGIENNLYPFVFLNVDGNLFIFANNRAILFDYNTNKVVKTYPVIPGADPRNYPSTGSAVLLPLKNLQGNQTQAEVLVCGGAPRGSYIQALRGNFVKALDTCGRIKITDPNPVWVMETMPQPRSMGDLILLPNGNVLIINGAGTGTAGWEFGRNPVLRPALYRPENGINSRFESLNPTGIPRMYHSSAILVRDGRILVGGSNPHVNYNFSGVLFPTELRLEEFYPPYLDAQYGDLRPAIVSPISKVRIRYGQRLVVRFKVTSVLNAKTVSVKMVSPSFTTHSFSMNQRLLDLGNEKVTNVGTATFDIQVTSPSSSVLAPPGYYLCFVVHQDIPSVGIWVQVN